MIIIIFMLLLLVVVAASAMLRAHRYHQVDRERDQW